MLPVLETEGALAVGRRNARQSAAEAFVVGACRLLAAEPLLLLQQLPAHLLKELAAAVASLPRREQAPTLGQAIGLPLARRVRSASASCYEALDAAYRREAGNVAPQRGCRAVRELQVGLGGLCALA